jgi:hypothetical protein
MAAFMRLRVFSAASSKRKETPRTTKPKVPCPTISSFHLDRPDRPQEHQSADLVTTLQTSKKVTIQAERMANAFFEIQPTLLGPFPQTTIIRVGKKSES